MPSFDVVNEIDMQEMDNAVNNVKKEVETRYDFRNSTTEIDLHKGDKRVNIVAGDEMKMRALQDMLHAHCVRRKVDPRCLEFLEIEPTSRGAVKRGIKINEGISKDIAKKIVTAIKASKIKVQAAIQDEQVRVTGKKIDDLQAVMALLREGDYAIPLQFVNMKS
ncbi:MAG: YajQ family cyclic di-GMP-binding protein [Pseudomonadota bacterium]